MPPPHFDYWFGTFVLALATASLAMCVTLLSRPRPVLRYQPRRPVPWDGVAALLAVIFVAMTVVPHLFQPAAVEKPPVGSALQYIQQMLLHLTFTCVLVGSVLAVVIAICEPSLRDLGLPEFVSEMLGDIKLGGIAWLVALVPVYGIQAALLAFLGESEGHPLIRMISDTPNPALFATAFVVAVIGAPICEEITFRLLLQGWLEKWEDAQLGWRKAELADALVDQPAVKTASDPGDVPYLAGEESAATVCPPPELRELNQPPEPPRRGVAGLPHGWFPILASSTLFALAHFGYGPEPIPLFLLAIVLGYTYQRTHRIVPCIVTHALFNLLSVLALWWITAAPPHELGP